MSAFENIVGKGSATSVAQESTPLSPSSPPHASLAKRLTSSVFTFPLQQPRALVTRSIAVQDHSSIREIRPLETPPTQEVIDSYCRKNQNNWEKGIPEPPLNVLLPRAWEDFTPQQKVLGLARFLKGANPDDPSVIAIVLKTWDFISTLDTDKEILEASQAAEQLPLTERTKEQIADIDIPLKSFFFNEVSSYQLKAYWRNLLVRDSEFFAAFFSGHYASNQSIEASYESFKQLLEAQYLDRPIDSDFYREVYLLGRLVDLLPAVYLKDILNAYGGRIRNTEKQGEFIQALDGFSKRPNQPELQQRLIATVVETYLILEDARLKSAYLQLICKLDVKVLRIQCDERKIDTKELIRACPNLVRLSIVQNHTYPSFFPFDVPLKRLRHLSLNNCIFLSNEFLEFLAKNHPRLLSVDFKRCCDLKEELIIKLVELCPNIVSIELERPSVVCQRKIIEKLKKLKKFVFYKDAFLLERGFPQLRNLTCEEINVTNQGTKFLNFLKGAPNLKSLRFYGEQITQDTLFGITSFSKHLTKVELYANCTDNHVSLFAESYPNLVHLDLRGSYCLTDISIKKIAEKCRGLESLHLSDVMGSSITDEAIIAIAVNCTHLRKIVLPTSATDKSIYALSSSCKSLERLSSAEGKATSNALFAIATRFPLLRSLYISISGGIPTDLAFTLLHENCSMLNKGVIRTEPDIGSYEYNGKEFKFKPKP